MVSIKLRGLVSLIKFISRAAILTLLLIGYQLILRSSHHGLVKSYIEHQNK